MTQPASDYLVIGAGIVGLACAYELRTRHPGAKITILEKEALPGLHASGRNSGVLHSGIYYAPGSLKAAICTRGARRMREFAREHQIGLLEKGKLIVACGEEDLPGLARLMENARANGVGAELLDEAGVRSIEPFARAFRQAIFIRDTAVIDSPALVHTLARILQSRGVELRTGEALIAAQPSRKEVRSRSGRFAYGKLINCAGAYANRIAHFFGAGRDYALVPFKGLYYQLRPERAAWVRSNIYPVPKEGFPFLGIHFTRHPDGTVSAGPTAIPVLGRENYRRLEGLEYREWPEIAARLMRLYFAEGQFRRLVHEELLYYWKPRFVRQARKLLPAVRSEDLIPGAKAGIRPQLISRRTGKLEMDYVVEKAGASLHILNAVSPALTSAFAFAELIADRTAED